MFNFIIYRNKIIYCINFSFQSDKLFLNIFRNFSAKIF